MNLYCLFGFHTYETISKTYTPPNKRINTIENVTERLIERITYGFTTILNRCSKCGRLHTQILIGEHV